MTDPEGKVPPKTEAGEIAGIGGNDGIIDGRRARLGRREISGESDCGDAAGGLGRLSRHRFDADGRRGRRTRLDRRRHRVCHLLVDVGRRSDEARIAGGDVVEFGILRRDRIGNPRRGDQGGRLRDDAGREVRQRDRIVGKIVVGESLRLIDLARSRTTKSPASPARRRRIRRRVRLS